MAVVSMRDRMALVSMMARIAPVSRIRRNAPVWVRRNADGALAGALALFRVPRPGTGLAPLNGRPSRSPAGSFGSAEMLGHGGELFPLVISAQEPALPSDRGLVPAGTAGMSLRVTVMSGSAPGFSGRARVHWALCRLGHSNLGRSGPACPGLGCPGLGCSELGCSELAGSELAGSVLRCSGSGCSELAGSRPGCSEPSCSELTFSVSGRPGPACSGPAGSEPACSEPTGFGLGSGGFGSCGLGHCALDSGTACSQGDREPSRP